MLCKKELNEFAFPVVHIATHGQFSSQAENTFILAYDRKINVKELDALLRNRDREGSNPIELLVFSACETARGDDRAALGLAGVAVRAGARSTLATLWQVSDRSTAELMAEFYRELAAPNTSKALALRRAQLSIMKQRRYAIPYFLGSIHLGRFLAVKFSINMWHGFGWLVRQWVARFVAAPSVAGIIILLRVAGLLQPLELNALDEFFRLRPAEPADRRIVIVGIDESDIRLQGEWPIPDGALARLLTKN